MAHIKQHISYEFKKISSRHLTSVVTKDMSGATEALSYAHLFNQCTQDWFSVASILEDLLTKLKARNPLIQRAYLKSDEAGCYHNSSLIAAVRDIVKRVGVTVHSYHYSEPQSGKDICDRILCPLKSSIRMYCNERHDVLTAADMRDALIQHPVKGTSATVCVVNESRKTLSVTKSSAAFITLNMKLMVLECGNAMVQAMESTFHMKCFMSPIRFHPLSKHWNPKNSMYHLDNER